MLERIKSYYKGKTKWNLVSDGIFVVLLVLLVIPQTRQIILPPVQRLFLFSPSEKKADAREVLSETDWLWQIETSKNGLMSLHEKRGEVIFINFWATWCPPCVAELPSIESLYEDYKDKVTFMLISQEDFAKTQTFRDKKEYTFPLYKATQAPPALLNSSSIPTTVLIDRKGRIVMKEMGAADWDSKSVRKTIDRLLSEPE